MTERNLYRYRYLCQTESELKYEWSENEPLACITDPGHTIDTASIAVVDTIRENNRYIRGKNTDGDDEYYNCKVTDAGKLGVDVPLSAFGYTKTVSEYPIIQADVRYGIDPNIFVSTIVNTGSVAASNTVATVSSGIDAAGSAELTTKRYFTYRAGFGANIMFTIAFGTPQANNTQLGGLGTGSNGFFFGYNGTSFGVLQRNNGVDTWTPRASWNYDTLDGTGPSGITITETYFQIYKITFQWLGYGVVTWMIANPATGSFVKVHSIALVNTAASGPTVVNPSFPFVASSTNTGNTTDVPVRFTCFGSFLEGQNLNYGLNFAIDNTKQSTEAVNILNILTIRVKSNINTIPAYVNVRMLKASIGVQDARTIAYYIILNGTLTGVPVYADINTTSSVVEYDTSGTFVTGGRVLLSGATSRESSRESDLLDHEIILNQGDTISVGTRTLGANNVTVASLCWLEER